MNGLALTFLALSIAARPAAPTNLRITSGPPLPLLESVANAQVSALLSGKTTNQNWFYDNPYQIATSQTVWTYPVDLSCVGGGDNGYGFFGCLIASNVVLVNQHILGGQTRFLFTSTNGNTFQGTVSNYVLVPESDFAIGILSESMPPEITPAWVFPPTLTNYLTDGKLDGVLGFWVHRNAGVINLGEYFSYPSGAIALTPALTNDFSQDGHGTPGDSGSPAFVTLTNGQPVVMFTTTGSDPSGWPPFLPVDWSAMPVQGLRIIDLSRFSPAPGTH